MVFAVNGERQQSLDVRPGRHAEVVLTADGTVNSTAEIAIEMDTAAPVDFSLERRTPSFRLLQATVE
jgi:hypothetical protein